MESQTLFSEICRTVEHMIITYVRGMWRLSCVFIISNLYIYPIVSLSDCKILAEPYTLYTSFLTCFYSVSLCVCLFHSPIFHVPGTVPAAAWPRSAAWISCKSYS